MATGIIVKRTWSLTIVCSYVFLSCLDALISVTPAATDLLGLAGNETDRLALLSIKKNIISYDPLGVLSSWNDSNHFCNWRGVTCSSRDQRVTVLDLSSQQVVGSLSPHVGNLSFLQALVLHNNTFGNAIPPEIGRLFRLETLGLENNSFTDEIPVNLSQCLSLKYLGLDGNKLSGEIPVELGMSLRNLEILFLRSNNLIGEIPSSIGNLSSLVALAAMENNLHGSIPEALGTLKNLAYISLGTNNLSGSIPLSIFNLSSLYHIAAPQNQIQGNLPSDMGLTLPNLRYIYMHSNLLSGEIPSSISNASNLLQISLSANQFTGKVPSLGKLHSLISVGIHKNNLGYGEANDLDFFSSLINCTSFEGISLNYNNFGGALPQNIGNFSTKLRGIGMASNQLVGSIPSGISNLINFEALSLEDNHLTGEIPEILGKLKRLKYLTVDGNKLSGEIPSSLGNLTLLYKLNLAQNNLQGKIPSSLGNCTHMNMLSLSQNKLSGTIPKEVIGLSSLSVHLDLSQNLLSGSLPPEVGKLISIQYLKLSQNKISGELPSTIGSCIGLEELHLQDNLFGGSLPSSLSSLRGIEYLDFSRNNFSGEIPKYFLSFGSLKILNLSFNSFEGEVPAEGVFSNSSAISINENKNLCGGTTEMGLPPCIAPTARKGRLYATLKIVLIIVSGILGLTLVLFICLSRKKKLGLSSNVSYDNSLLNLSYGEIMKASRGFSSENLVGVGGFGSVYKGILGQNGAIVAIKVLNLQHKGASKSFNAECEAMRNLRHRNIVKLITSCSGLDSQGNDFKALIYEFMVNGSLDSWLHPIPEGGEGALDGLNRRTLNFHQRLNIAIDIALALEYIYYGGKVPLVHCDLKPSNVLLDADMAAHVGDFGLARFLQQNAQLYHTTNSSSIAVKGSIGYAAPEYGMGSEVSTYGDIYSFGIVLLELFTGKRPTDDMFKDGLNLHNFVKMAALPDRVQEIVDPLLLEEKIETSDCGEILTLEKTESITSNVIDECLTSLFRIAVGCTVESPKERSHIRDVVKDLQLVRERYLGTLNTNKMSRKVEPNW